MIEKTSGGYKVLSEKGKNLGGPYKSRAKAQKRLRQVEFFKHRSFGHLPFVYCREIYGRGAPGAKRCLVPGPPLTTV
jgi:hypothetical protein